MESQASEGSGDWVHLGEAIRHGRRRTGMTQEELAAAAKVDRKTVGNYERGRVPSTAPRVPDGYYRVAEALLWRQEDIRRLLKSSSGDLRRRVRELRMQQRQLQAIQTPTPEETATLDGIAARLYLLDWELGHGGAAGPSSLAAEPTDLRASEADVLRWAASRPEPEEPIRLFPEVVRFGQACVKLGAEPEMRDQLLYAAQQLLAQAASASPRDDFELAAYRPHGWAEGDPGVPEDDAARIRKAVEEHHRNR